MVQHFLRMVVQKWARTPRVCIYVVCLAEKLSVLLAKTFKSNPDPLKRLNRKAVPYLRAISELAVRCS